jgi:hypothetical protein
MLIESAFAFANFSSAQVLTLWIVAMGVTFLILVSLAGIIVPAWASVHKARLEMAFKQQLLDRGMAAEEIFNLVNGPKQDPTSVDYPCASEVVVEWDGDWYRALILKREDDRYYVHYVGHDMSENEWVTGDRVRFPAEAKDSCGAPWDWASAAGASDSLRRCANKSKPAAVDAEL